MGPDGKLREMGHNVEQFTECHFRVADQIDFWLPRGKWHDLVTNERGQKPLDQIPFWIDQRLRSRTPEQLEKQQFIVNLLDIGWRKEDAKSAWQDRQKKKAGGASPEEEGQEADVEGNR